MCALLRDGHCAGVWLRTALGDSDPLARRTPPLPCPACLPACLPSPAWFTAAASASCWRLNVAGAYTVPHSLLVLVLWVLLVLVVLVLAAWSAGSTPYPSAPWVRSPSRRPSSGARVGVG